jgi:hypothetical protein
VIFEDFAGVTTRNRSPDSVSPVMYLTNKLFLKKKQKTKNKKQKKKNKKN